MESLKTKAERICDASGNVTHYKLNGVKQFISNGAIADLYTILAKARRRPDVLRGRTQHARPLRRQAGGEARHPPVQHLAGGPRGRRHPGGEHRRHEEGQGIKQSNEVFGFTRLMVAAFGLGARPRGAREARSRISKERKQFGTFLCEKQGYTHKLLVPHSVKLAAAQAYIEYVADAARLERDGPADRRLGGEAVRDRGGQARRPKRRCRR